MNWKRADDGSLTDFPEGGQPLPAGDRRTGAGHAVTLAVDLGQGDHRLRAERRRAVTDGEHIGGSEGGRAGS